MISIQIMLTGVTLLAVLTISRAVLKRAGVKPPNWLDAMDVGLFVAGVPLTFFGALLSIWFW